MSNPAQARMIETGDFTGDAKPEIRRLTHSRQLFEVYQLTYECYIAQRQHLPRHDGLWIPYPQFDHAAETTIFVAELEGEIVGTVSVTLDGKRGLPMEETFPRTYQLTRESGRPLAQVWRLLVKESCPITDPIITSLVAEAVQYLLLRGPHTVMVLIQKEQVELCLELLNAITLIDTPSALALSDARSVLLRTDTENLKNALPTGETGDRHERTSYSHCR